MKITVPMKAEAATSDIKILPEKWYVVDGSAHPPVALKGPFPSAKEADSRRKPNSPHGAVYETVMSGDEYLSKTSRLHKVPVQNEKAGPSTAHIFWRKYTGEKPYNENDVTMANGAIFGLQETDEGPVLHKKGRGKWAINRIVYEDLMLDSQAYSR